MANDYIKRLTIFAISFLKVNKHSEDEAYISWIHFFIFRLNSFFFFE